MLLTQTMWTLLRVTQRSHHYLSVKVYYDMPLTKVLSNTEDSLVWELGPATELIPYHTADSFGKSTGVQNKAHVNNLVKGVVRPPLSCERSAARSVSDFR